MGKGPSSFKQTDLGRAYKAALAAGMPAPRIVVDTKQKTFSIVPGGGEPSKDAAASNPWDEVLTDAAHEERAS